MRSSVTQPDRNEMARLLEAAGSAYDPEAIEALIEGVLAAPAEIGTGWHVLVADPMPQQLAACARSAAGGQGRRVPRRPFTRRFRSAAASGASRPACARNWRRGGLDGFIVPRADEHQGEYVPPRGQRLAWLTGFTGSAGLAIVLRDRAALFVDGRYTLQAAAQVDTGSFEIHHLVEEPPAQWLATALKKGEVLGYDPWLHTPHEVERFRAAAEKAGAELRAVHDNPLDKVWSGQPAAPIAPVVPHPEQFSGESADVEARPAWVVACKRRGSRQSS